MKKIIRIARVELGNMFYSPIAWLLLVIFIVQCSLSYIDSAQAYLQMQQLTKLFPFGMKPVTYSLLSEPTRGMFPAIVSKLYLYIPLLTMGLISREVSSGSIRLLYSSPVRTSQIVLGKFLAMMIYNILLVIILGIFVVTTLWTVPHADLGMMLSGLLGFLLLLGTYAAIGLFMSCLTSYQVVAALSTLAVFAALQYVGKVWQGMDFIRDLTYFLSLGYRTQDMFEGMITSRDVIYFIVIAIVFLSFSIMRLKADQEYLPGWQKALRYIGVVVIAIGVGYITSRPAAMFYVDATAKKVNTLTPATQELLKSTNNEPLELTAYVNLLDRRYSYGAPDQRNTYLRTWERYTRFKPIDYQFYYYYDTSASTARMFEQMYKGKSVKEVAAEFAKTNDVNLDRFKSPAEARKIPGLPDEGGRMVLQLKYKGKTTLLRMYDDQEVWPSEAHFTAALKRLMKPEAMPKAGFLTGHLERTTELAGSRNYAIISVAKTFRGSLINNGFDIVDVADGQDIPAGLAVLVIADPKESFSETTLARLRKYIADGGNLLITTEPGKQAVIAPLLSPLGVKMRDGILVGQLKGEPADAILGIATSAAGNLSQGIVSLYRNQQPVSMSGAGALDFVKDSSSFEAQPILMSVSDMSWLKKGKLVSDSAQVVFSEADGDESGNFNTALALKRTVNGREQRIIVTSDADFMSNQTLQLKQQTNIPFSAGAFKWLSGGVFPIEQSRMQPKDMELEFGDKRLSLFKLLVLWILPGVLLLAGTILLIRRKRK